ncbi:MAG: hypothetical protein K2J30_00200, partial [Clostridia bacterium]|nr:hypothetical protein [Clostridia bacterium]
DVSVSQGTYYFKVEPIRWRILKVTGGTAMLMCDSVIDVHTYQSDYKRVTTISGGGWFTTANGAPDGTSALKYQYSGVRAWLNGEFYQEAFTEAQQAIIQTSTVENGSSSISPNDYLPRDISPTTYDKVFLLSYAEATNTAYGFNKSEKVQQAERCVGTSDYSRALGVTMNTTSGEEYGNGRWMLRSPSSSNYPSVWAVAYTGMFTDSNSQIMTSQGMVPVINITLSE